MTTRTLDPGTKAMADTRPVRQLVFEEMAYLLNQPVSTWLDPTARDGKYIHVLIYRRHNNAGPDGKNFDLFVAIRPLASSYKDIKGLRVSLGGVIAEANQFGIMVFYNLSDGWYDLQAVAE